MSLLAWYPFNGNMNNNGLVACTITGTPSYSNDGKIGQCLSSSENHILTVPGLSGSKVWSICFWGYVISSSITSNWTRVIQCGDGGTNLRCEVCPQGNYEDCCYSFHNNTANKIINVGLYSPYGGFYDQWAHVCITSDGSTVKTYYNGIFKSSTGYTGDGTLNGTIVIENNSKIKKNDFRVYDNCLSDREVKEISKGLVCHYILDNSMTGQENLFIGTSMTANERTVHPLASNAPVVVTDYFRCYNGSIGLHSFSEDIDEITLNEASNLGIAFQRKATDINLDTSSYYTLSCEAKCNRPDAKLSIARSYMNNSGNWIWRGGELQQSFNNTTDWQKFKLTFIPDADTQYISYNFTVPTTSASTDYKFWIRHCKLEKGTEATPYTLNREDADYTRLGLNSGIEYDCGGYGYNGTKYNTAIADKYNRYLNSTKFTRSPASYINCGTARAGSIRDQITISFWAYRDNWASNNTETFLSCTEAGGYSMGIYTSSSTGRIITFYMGSGASTSNTYIIIKVENNLTPGWHLFTGTYDGYGTKYYIDGELVGTNDYYSTKTPIYYNTNIPLLIGCEPYGVSATGDNFDGNISDVRIYATALSAEDIKELYNTSAYIDNKGNICCYEFIEG